MSREHKINAKRALLRVLDKELEPLIGQGLRRGSTHPYLCGLLQDRQDRALLVLIVVLIGQAPVAPLVFPISFL